jgi:hypothetical protein
MGQSSQFIRSISCVTHLVLASYAGVIAGCEAAVGPVMDVQGAAVEVPDEHPCAELALPGRASRLWEDLVEEQRTAPMTLLIPLEAEQTALVSQGNVQEPTHLGSVAFAWDLVVDEDTVVVASAPGVVVWVRDDSGAHAEAVEALDDANWIVVDHGAGLFTSYVHLAEGSAVVEPGQSVEAGERLARTGLSGQLTGPHLHVQLENAWSASLPAAFVELEEPRSCGWVPSTGETVQAATDVAPHLVWRGAASEIPADAFSAYGVRDLRGPQARLMSRSALVEVTGEVDEGRDDVWFMVFPEGGGDAVSWLRMQAADRRFEGVVDLRQLPLGRYGWAVVAVAQGESPNAPVAVRMSLID